MKFTTKLFLTWTFIFLIFYLAIIAIISLFWGIRIPFWQLLLAFFIAGVLPPAFLTMLFYKRLDYMESEDQEPPTFAGQRKAMLTFNARSDNHYAELLQKIDRSFIVSYSDKDAGIVKFRTDSRIMSWGIGGYVKLMEDGKVKSVIYPMNPKSKREKKLLLQTLRLLKSILNP